VGWAAILPDWGQGGLVAARSLPVSSYIFSRQEMWWLAHNLLKKWNTEYYNGLDL